MADPRDTALATLVSPTLEPIVEVVLLARDGAYEAHAVDGSVRFRREPVDPGAPACEWRFTVEEVTGRNPLGDQAIDRFAGLDAEVSNRFPDRTANAYPYAYEQVAQLFDHPCAPDLCVVHTASHHWADQGGHIGEHGSLGAVQCRAPFIISGPGVRRDGMVEGVEAQLVDIAPTVLALLGHDPEVLDGRDGEPLHRLLDADAISAGDGPAHVVGLLLDGCNPNVLYDAVASGDAPNIASLMADGTTLRSGIVSSLPTVTLPNHTSIITGRHPGHHGILHNAWWDRGRGAQVITNSPETWATAMSSLLPGTDSVHLALQRCEPGAFTASVNEPADHGAGYSTFDLLRRGVRMEFPHTAEGLPHTTEMFVRPVKDYATFTQVDHHGTTQAVAILGGSYLGVDYPLPRFLWVNFALTDSAFHEGGPHSEIARASIRDTDGRIGEVLAALQRRGIRDRTAVFLCADHGMEESNPAVGGDWSPALAAAGLDVRDEAFGFLYLDP
ncbi:MAG: alkaline phosphatase family protein [Actinobacteria bacterium]|nr:alkaline phosphatase family protein [Actinomycetota bacterium]